MNCDQSPTHPRNVLYDLAIPSRHPSALNADVALKGGPSCQASVLEIFISAFDKTVQPFQAVMVKLRPRSCAFAAEPQLFQATSQNPRRSFGSSAVVPENQVLKGLPPSPFKKVTVLVVALGSETAGKRDRNGRPAQGLGG
jgi:hypothetical protein